MRIESADTKGYKKIYKTFQDYMEEYFSSIRSRILYKFMWDAYRAGQGHGYSRGLGAFAKAAFPKPRFTDEEKRILKASRRKRG